jgi:signal transduction histidine kinase
MVGREGVPGMEQMRQRIAEKRANTDASLGAERAGVDAATDRLAEKAQRALDDLIERDRIWADQGLLKFRENADGVLARERSASPPRDHSVVAERQAADDDKKAERKVTDALLDRERQKADSVTETERLRHDADRTSMDQQRQDTNDQLSTERGDADQATSARVETRGALAHSKSARIRGSDVLGMVAHDLRSPLCVIAMNSESIAALTDDRATRDAAEDVMRAAARMERILADLIDVARIEAGTLRIVKAPLDVGILVNEVFQTYRPLFSKRGLTFLVTLPNPSVMAVFDHDRIIQVLSNLLGNAMKFTPAGGTVRLHVETRSDQVEFVLHNTGPGIAPTALPHIFERFWQIDSDGRRGLGLGLHICEQIVAGHGGRIWAESETGQGATFRFTLPLTAPSSA